MFMFICMELANHWLGNWLFPTKLYSIHYFNSTYNFHFSVLKITHNYGSIIYLRLLVTACYSITMLDFSLTP